VASAADNPPLCALIDAFANRTQRARLWVGLNNNGQVRASHGDHTRILGALQVHNPDRARLLMSHHLLVMEDYIHDQTGSPPDQ
jgi:GntR family transcriptional regulator, transcriptional repressor for pyruvate dehydrogenase complex